MGQLLSQPITEKNITFVQHDHISHSIGEMQGYRLSMEDAYCDINDTIPIKITDKELRDRISNLEQPLVAGQMRDVPPASETLSDHLHTNFLIRRVKINIYGVFDGHGGSSTSQYMAERLPPILTKRLRQEIKKLTDDQKWKLINGEDVLELINFPKVMKDTFMKLDSMHYHSPNNNSGSTGVVALLFQNYIIVGNSGDSRCVLSTNGAAKNMSLDHKPKHLGELMRIHNDGGYVAANRVNSILALSRAFGDYNFKMNNSRNHGKFALVRSNQRVRLTPPEEYQVTSEPDVFIRKITRNDEFLVIACDGVWDCYKPQGLVHVIRHELSLGKKLTDVNEMVLDNCIGMANTITGIGFDNMTLIIVALHQDLRDLNDWYTHLKNKVLDEKFGRLGH
ncbi:DEKNAAC104899 [Brettanomyces naardenensis]|uniref:protein-serine/threonine phosphatase n=1 Tax=Brettanomyces naardenensis TaxID=13370 RepID=A0A448YS20_BRENA|nr:DEKNAAC104899 [Brettanomyces naardenensis]